MQAPSRIGVFSRSAFGVHERLARALYELYGAVLVEADRRNSEKFDGLLVMNASAAEATQLATENRVPCLAYLEATEVESNRHSTVAIAKTSDLPAPLRGLELPHSHSRPAEEVSCEGGDQVVASEEGRPIWVHRCRNGVGIDLLACRPPVLASEEYLFENGEREGWLALIALIQFVRSVTGWRLPPYRACFMFDDPNLHWKSYGYVNFREIADDAKQHGYHVAFATVPMDGWYVHPGTAKLFRDRAEQLSLLAHGNDHLWYELHKPRIRSQQLGIAAQALSRIQRMEQTHGIPVPRIMAAPHGACSYEMAQALLDVGFEGACISRGSLMARNPALKWPVSVGLQPTEVMAGLPVMPRMSIRVGSDVQERLALFWGQAAVFVGHHQDLRGGLSLLRSIAGRVREGTNVKWMNIEEIARTSFLNRQCADVMHVRMYSRHVTLRVSSAVTKVAVDLPWLPQPQSLEISVNNPQAGPRTFTASTAEPFDVLPGARLSVRVVHDSSTDSPDPPAIPVRVKAALRRGACELRDRLRPAAELFWRNTQT